MSASRSQCREPDCLYADTLERALRSLYLSSSEYRFQVLPTEYERFIAENLDDALGEARAALRPSVTDFGGD